MKNLLTTIAAATSLTAAAHTTELPQDFQDPAMQKEIAANLEATHNQENTYILGSQEEEQQLKDSITELPGEKAFRAQFEGKPETDQKMMEHTIQVVNNITEAYKKVDSLITAKNYDAAKAAIDAISVNERKEFGPTRKALVDAGYDPAFLISVGPIRATAGKNLTTLENEKIALSTQAKIDEIDESIANQKEINKGKIIEDTNQKEINKGKIIEDTNQKEINAALSLINAFYTNKITKKELKELIIEKGLSKGFLGALESLGEKYQNDFKDITNNLIAKK